MRAALIQVTVVLVLAILHSSFFTAFGNPVSLVNLPLVLIVALATGLRATPAVIAAVVSGLVMDTLLPVGFGTYTTAMIAVSAVVVLSLSTVLTHLSFFSFLGANAVAFLLFHAIVFLLNAGGRILAGLPIVPAGTEAALKAVMLALPLQILVCVLVRVLTTRFRKRMSDFIVVR